MTKQKFSSNWKSSKKPKKQRKYRYNAPLHIKSKFLNVHLSKQLREKYKKRSIRVKKGDKIKILKGQFKNKEGNIDRVLLKKTRVIVQGIEITKKDGTKTTYPIHPSNIMIIELNLEDKQRVKALQRGI